MTAPLVGVVIEFPRLFFSAAMYVQYSPPAAMSVPLQLCRILGRDLGNRRTARRLVCMYCTVLTIVCMSDDFPPVQRA